MGSYDAFEGAEETGVKGPEKAFWELDFSDEDELLQWLNAEVDHLKNQAIERHINQRKNLAIYRGIHYQSQDVRTREEALDRAIPQQKRTRNPRVVYNHMVDMVEQDVARATKYRGAINCTPPTDDPNDRATAKVAEQLIEKFWKKVDFDHHMQMHVRRKNIKSEDYFGVFWDQHQGPYDIDWVAAVFKEVGIKDDPRKMTKAQLRRIWLEEIENIPKLPMLDDAGKQMKDEAGNPLWITEPLRRGEVRYKLIASDDMFLQRKRDYKNCEYGMFREFVHSATVKRQHPSKASEIEPDNVNIWDTDTLDDESPGNKVEVWHFFHKTTRELDAGRYIKFCRTAILKNRTNPYVGWDDQRIFPWARTVDIETPEVLNGDSKVTYGRPCQAVYNNLISMRIRSHFLVAHPKWFYPTGSVKAENLSNGGTLVQYKGPVAPQLVQPTVPPNDEALLTRSKDDYQQIMAVYGVSRGEPPPGVTAAVALTFLDEQENERANVGIADLTRTQREVALMTLWLMADHYDNDRLTEMVGKEQANLINDFEMSNLRDIADLDLNNGSALPQQKSARMQYMLDVKKEWPGLMPDDVAVDLLDLAEVKRFQNIITVAIRKADNENDSFTNNKPVAAPMEQEYHLQHYRSHMKMMNEVYYTKLPANTQNAMKEHIMATELLMCQIIQKFPMYVQQVLNEFPSFPVFFKPGAQIVQQALQAMMPQPNGGPGGPPPPTAVDPQALQQIPGSDMLPNPGSEEIAAPGQPPGAAQAMPV